MCTWYDHLDKLVKGWITWYMFFIENPHMVDYMYKLRMFNAYAECSSFTWILITKCLTCWCIHIGLIKGVVTIMLLYSQNSQETFGSFTGDLRVIIHRRPSGHYYTQETFGSYTGDLRVKFSYGAGQTTTQWYIWNPGRYIVCLVTTYKKEYSGICIWLYDTVTLLFIVFLCLIKFDLWWFMLTELRLI